MKTIWFIMNILFGRRFLANVRSKEIHDMVESHRNCFLFDIVDYKLVSRRKAMKMMKNEGYNGCRWCMMEYDTDIKK